jgi:hypothetical protein
MCLSEFLFLIKYEFYEEIKTLESPWNKVFLQLSNISKSCETAAIETKTLKNRISTVLQGYSYAWTLSRLFT